MICPVCKHEVPMKKNHCEKCGEDLTAYKKVYQISNKYYNEGLERAKVRDLSGAAIVLRKSLEYNKRNTNARNLLGLIYFEMGESVAALSEWVISKHFQPEANDADEYMNSIQSTPTKLDMLNQTTKKYNAALVAAKQGNDDLAIIQLKKVTSLNPHFVKALQLLALLYMKTGEREKALKYLTRAERIDVSNTATLRYLKELSDIIGERKEDSKTPNKEVITPKENTVFRGSSYKEDKPNIWLFINLVIGVVIGVLATVFLIVPTVRTGYTADINENLKIYNSERNKLTQSIDSITKEKTELQTQIEDLQKQIDEYSKNEYDDTIYDALMSTAKLYNDEILNNNVNQIDFEGIAKELAKVDEAKLERPQAKALYNQIKDAVSEKASAALYDEGYSLYTNRKYDEALELLLDAYEYDPQNVDVIYFIGRTYHQLANYDKAKEYYNIITKDFSDSDRNSKAISKLAELN
ncbi:MAG: hypothetical protein K0S61_2685 [Anaerocolumna sp.]|nr:hypothetical protein [Anaerocolumna sp.]